MSVVNFSDVSATHEEIMSNPDHAPITESLSSLARFKDAKYFVAKEDTEGNILAGGPLVRNAIIMKFIKIYIEGYVDRFNGRDKENKIVYILIT